MDEILDQMAAKVGTLTRIVEDFGSQSVQNAYDYQQPDYSQQYYYLEFQNNQTLPWSYNNHMSYQSECSYSTPQSKEQESSLEELLVKHIEQNDMRMYNQEVYPPSLVYPPEICYEPLQQQEDESHLEELLTKFIEQTEVQMSNRDASIVNITNQLELLTNAFMNLPQRTSPRIIETYLESDGEEHCVVTLSSDNECYEAIGENCENLKPSVEGACNTRQMENKTDEYEEMVEEGQVGNSFDVMPILSAPVEPFFHPVQNLGEYFRVEIVENTDKREEVPSGSDECFRVEIVKGAVADEADENYFLPLVDNKFGDLPPRVNADPYDEKAKRRHGVMKFARNPD